MVQALRAEYALQRADVLTRLTGAKARRGTRHWKPEGTKAIDVAALWNANRWDTRMSQAGQRLMQALYGDAGTVTAGTLGAKYVFDVHDPKVTDAIAGRTVRIVGTNETTRQQVADTIAQGEAEGETIPQLAERVGHVFDVASDSRAEMIARTETIGGANEGSMLSAQQSGIVSGKTWLSAQDDRVRETHAEADGQTVALDEPFLVGEDELMFPGDEAGPPEEVISCRCVMTYEVDESPSGEG